MQKCKYAIYAIMLVWPLKYIPTYMSIKQQNIKVEEMKQDSVKLLKFTWLDKIITKTDNTLTNFFIE